MLYIKYLLDTLPYMYVIFLQVLCCSHCDGDVEKAKVQGHLVIKAAS